MGLSLVGWCCWWWSLACWLVLLVVVSRLLVGVVVVGFSLVGWCSCCCEQMGVGGVGTSPDFTRTIDTSGILVIWFVFSYYENSHIMRIRIL